MPRRRRRSSSAFLIPLTSVGGLFALLSLIRESGVLAATGFVVVISVGIYQWRRKQKAARLAALRQKYGDEEVVQRIMNKQYWSGQTADQLRDSLGDAVSIGRDLLRTRKREVWKYGEIGRGQYRLRVTLDQDIVIGTKTLGR